MEIEHITHDAHKKGKDHGGDDFYISVQCFFSFQFIHDAASSEIF